jgi:uncharacterized membrane protein
MRIPHIICTPEERAKAAEILASCEDKPVKRITHSSQLPGWRPPTRIEEETLARKASRKEKQVVDYIKARANGVPTAELNNLVDGGKESARHTLEKLEERGIIKSRLSEVYRGNGLKTIRIWEMA